MHVQTMAIMLVIKFIPVGNVQGSLDSNLIQVQKHVEIAGLLAVDSANS